MAQMTEIVGFPTGKDIFAVRCAQIDCGTTQHLGQRVPQSFPSDKAAVA